MTTESVTETRTARRWKSWMFGGKSLGRTIAGACGVMAAVGLVYPLLSLPLAGVGLAIARRQARIARKYPLRMPVAENEIRRKNTDGIFFIGNETGSSKEIWLSSSDLRQHLLVIGADSPSKSNALVAAAANALASGSGFVIVSANKDASMYARIHGICREFHRDDDLLVANSVNGFSHTMNPFRTGDPTELSRLLIDMMDDMSGNLWKGRAAALMIGLLKVLCWLRDNKGFELNTGSIRKHMSIKEIVILIEIKDIPEDIKIVLRSYLYSLPGFISAREAKQSQTTLDQHGYLEMMYTKVLGSLSDVLGYIFINKGVDINIDDVVLNRRNLIVILPSLEKSHEEMCYMGKIVVSMLRNMMGRSLQTTLQGSWDEVIKNRNNSSPSPYTVILDECGYYIGEEASSMAAQARAAGFSMVYAAQCIPSMRRISEKVADYIIANTNNVVIFPRDGNGMEVQVGELNLHATGFDMGMSVGTNKNVAVIELLTLDTPIQNDGES